MRFSLIVFLSLFTLSLSCSKLNICYYTAWTGVQPDAHLCTHVIYSFADMSNGQLSGVWSNPLSHLRNSNPSIKILVAVGGWNFGVSRMTEMLASKETRQKFVDHAVNYLRQLDFDGLDLDFEYPGTNYPQYGRYSPPEDKQKFTLLCDVIT
jgi:chitinase